MKNKIFKSAKLFVSALIVISLLIAFGGPAAGSSGNIFEYDNSSSESPLFVPGEILVKFKHGVPDAVIDKLNAKHGTSILQRSPWGYMRISIPKSRSVSETVQTFSRNPNVEYAQPNSICRAVMTPNDSLYSLQWHLDNDEYGGINMENAWDLSTGAGVVVAVLDTGVAYENYDENGDGSLDYWQAPDLAGTAFVAGYDFINNDIHANDDESHGTHVAGTIAQSTNNGLGAAGVAYNTAIMPVKVLDSEGSGTAYALADGINFAADNGADVINMSLGWPWWRGRMYNPGPVVHNAVIYAYNQGVTLVAAAGNDRKNEVAYPAAYEECIAVGATQYDESLAPYTNKGSALDLTAPGGNLNVDQNGDGYGDGVLQQTFDPNTQNRADFGYWFFHGTSMATPHVSGVAALVIAAGVSGPDNVRSILQTTAEDHGSAGWDQEYGWGIVADANGPYSDTEDVAISFDASGSSDPDGDALSYTWDFGDGTVGSGVNPLHAYSWGDSFTVTLTVSDGRGGIETDTATATVAEVNDGPVADAGGPYSGVTNEPVTFDGSGSFDFDNEDGTSANDQVLTYSWDFGDGSTGSDVSPSHTYTAVGSYTVTLVVNDGVIDSLPSTTMVDVTEAPVGISLTGIEPNDVYAGGSTSVTISGSGFQSGATVLLEGSGGPTPQVSGVVVVDSATITATISTRSGGPPRDRYWDLRITNPDAGTAVLENGFIVHPG
jgi:serine protease